MVGRNHPASAASGSDILALIGDGVVSTDESGHILLFNRAAEEIFGYDADEIFGKAIEILLPSRFHARHVSDVQAFAAGSEATRRIMGHRREVLGRRKNGEEFPVEATLSWHVLDGRITLTVVIRDVSESRRFEQELEAHNRKLAASESRLRLALEGGRMGTWEWNLQNNELVGDGAMRHLWGLSEQGPLNVDDAFAKVHPDDLPELRRVLDRAIAKDGEFAREFRVLDREESSRWVAGQGAVLWGRAGEAETMVGVTFDVSERRELEEQRRLLAAELNHRMKNMMTLVQSVVSLTSRGTSSVDAYKQALQGRLGAIAKSLNLTQGGESRTTLLDQILRELEPFRNADGTNVVLEGPPISFDAKMGLSVGLVLHELATNAAKYGALSVSTGVVEVKWGIEQGDGSRLLTLEWRESGGPPVSPPTHRGFGSTLIETSLTRSLRGTVKFDYLPRGLLCRIMVPLDAAEN
jgi:PAS domain S-box-containing protein